MSLPPRSTQVCCLGTRAARALNPCASWDRRDSGGRAHSSAHTRTRTQAHINNMARFSPCHHICVVSPNRFSFFLSCALHSNTTSSFALLRPIKSLRSRLRLSGFSFEENKLLKNALRSRTKWRTSVILELGRLELEYCLDYLESFKSASVIARLN